MLKAKTIAKVLEQANTEGVQQSMLLSPEGSLVAYAGPSERNARLFAALAANIWTTYDKDVKDALDAAEPETITIDYQEGGGLMVVRVAQYLLMLHADAGVQRGLLKAKGPRLHAPGARGRVAPLRAAQAGDELTRAGVF